MPQRRPNVRLQEREEQNQDRLQGRSRVPQGRLLQGQRLRLLLRQWHVHLGRARLHGEGHDPGARLRQPSLRAERDVLVRQPFTHVRARRGRREGRTAGRQVQTEGHGPAAAGQG